MVEGQHLQGEIFSRTEKENRVESLPSPNSKKFGRLPQLGGGAGGSDMSGGR